MKNIFESPETFAAAANIGEMQYLIRAKMDEWERRQPKNGLELAIDKATGSMDAYDKEYYHFLIECFLSIIESKKILEIDCSSTEEVLKHIPL